MPEHDFAVDLNQSLVEKILDSAEYPLVISDRNVDFPGCDLTVLKNNRETVVLIDEQIDELFRRSLHSIIDRQEYIDHSTSDDIYMFGGSIIENYKKVLDASEKEGFEGVSAEDLRAMKVVVDEGIENLSKNLKPLMGDWGVYLWNPRLRVTLKKRPDLKVSSPKIDINDLEVEVFARGEIWSKFPWFNCHKWCLRWKKVIKCEKVLSISVSPDVEVGFSVALIADTRKVYASGKFTRLRLDYDILRELPLEDLANIALKSKRYAIYDASKLITTIPILESEFRIKSISLPKKPDGIRMEISMEQI